MKTKKILSMLVAMVMALSCVGITAMAVEGKVVNTEADLKAALETGGEAKLGGNIVINEMITVPQDTTVTLELNGYDITVKESKDRHIYAINNRGTLTLKDSVGTGSISARGIYNGYDGSDTDNTVDGAKMTIESGTYNAIDSNGGAAIFNCAELIINNGTFEGKTTAVNNRAKGKATINGGTYRSDSGAVHYAIQNNSGTMSINNATVDKGFGAVGIWGGSTIINDGNFLPTGAAGNTCHVVYVGGSSNVTINGGTFKMNYPADAVPDSGSAVASYYNGKLSITGGVFTSHFDNVSPVELSTGSEIIGGKYLAHSGETSTHSFITAYVSEGYELSADGSVEKKASFVAKIGDIEYATLAEAVANVKENETITILAGTISEGTIKLPATLKNVTFNGEEGAILEDMTIMASDGNSFSYIGLTFDGITFDNSRLIFTGWRNGEEVIENLTITNCVFQNLIDDTNAACVHINKAASEPVNGFIFINNVIDGATGGSKSGIYTVNTGKVIISGNTFNNIVFRPALVQLADCDGTVDNVVVSNNVISNTTRLQIYGSEVKNEDGTYTPVGTDTLAIAINDNIFQNITGYYICTWGINGESDIAENYYDGDISGKIYWNNEKPADEAGLAEIGVYPYYTELNTDGTINAESLVEAPTNKVAKIGDTTFTTLQAAIDAANNGDTIVVLADMTFESDLADAGKGYFNIPDGKKVTIDLNEKTINVTENSAGNFILFYNYGELTIKNGTVNLTSIQNRGWNAESAIILNRGGILNVESGTFTHLGGTDMAFVVDNSGNWFGEATANIEGGSLTSSYIAIRNRMEQNEHGYSGTAYLNIAGGTISGNSRAVWAQASSTSEKSPATGVINVTGGNIGKIDTARSSGAVCMTTVSGGTVASFKVEKGELKITGGIITGTLTILDASGNTVESDEIISGGIFSNDMKAYLADGYTLTENSDGTYSVESAGVLATENVLIQNMAQGKTEDGGTTYRVGCFAAIDSANYSLLGIEVKADGGKVTGSGTTQYLYTYINVTNSAGEVTKILPETLGETNKYIFGRIMAFTTNYTDFSFRPFAVSLDGKTTFYGNWSKEYTVDPE